MIKLTSYFRNKSKHVFYSRIANFYRYLGNKNRIKRTNSDKAHNLDRGMDTNVNKSLTAINNADHGRTVIRDNLSLI